MQTCIIYICMYVCIYIYMYIHLWIYMRCICLFSVFECVLIPFWCPVVSFQGTGALPTARRPAAHGESSCHFQNRFVKLVTVLVMVLVTVLNNSGYCLLCIYRILKQIRFLETPDFPETSQSDCGMWAPLGLRTSRPSTLRGLRSWTKKKGSVLGGCLKMASLRRKGLYFTWYDSKSM